MTKIRFQTLASEISYDECLAIAVSRSRCQALYRNWQDKNMAGGGELLEKELLEYARSLSVLPKDVWPLGKHSPDLQEFVEGLQREINMLTDDVTALYGDVSNVPE